MVLYDSANTMTAKVLSLLQNAKWCWALARSEDSLSIQGRLHEVGLSTADSIG
jgi:hypothetical protein